MVEPQSNFSKICSKCKSSLPRSSFYSKGLRIDSACKECIKAKKRLNIASRYRPTLATTISGENPSKPVKIEIDKDQLRDIQSVRKNLSSFFHLVFDLRRECSQKLLRSLESYHEVK